MWTLPPFNMDKLIFINGDVCHDDLVLHMPFNII